MKTMCEKVKLLKTISIMAYIDSVRHPGIFGDKVIAKMQKVKAITVLPYPYRNWTTFQKYRKIHPNYDKYA